MYKIKFESDYKFGTSKEFELLPIIKTYFNDDNIVQSTNKYSSYDFKSLSKRFELKSRNNEKDKYSTTMIGLNKITKCDKFEGDYYFLFCFTDGLFYIKYDKDIFEHFEVKTGGRYDRGRVEQNQYIYIPVDYLTKINL
jgi:hypothetical protein